MAKRGKKYIEANGKINKTRKYRLEEAVSLLKEVSYGKFVTTVELAIKLGVDPRHADQIVRGAVLLPAGTGREVKVLAFATGEKEKEAIDAGADFVGGEELIQKITQGWLDFDKVVATPDLMASVGKIGKILGPRGLMPNPKVGTVTFDLDRTIKELKTGKVEFRTDKSGIVQVPVGKISFDDKKLMENIHAVMDAVLKAKPSTAKGVYLRSITLSTTQSPGVKLDPTSMHLN